MGLHYRGDFDMKMEFLVKGIVERTVSVEGNCIRDGIANAKKEWSALTGGDLTTAETAFEELEDVQEDAGGD